MTGDCSGKEPTVRSDISKGLKNYKHAAQED
jgi:hypothetical protein